MLLKVIMLLFIINGLAIPCYGEDSLKPEEWCPASAGPITTWTAPVCDQGAVYIQPLFYFSQSKGYFFGQGDYFDWSDGVQYRQKQQIVFMQYG
ncbi:MAG: hypothetical protein V1843_05290, partial [bacterium]